MISPAPIIVCLGESLFDLIDGQAHLGGAPLNLACHAHQLGNQAFMATRIGKDTLGDQLIGELKDMPLDLVQVDDTKPTGIVRVSFDQTHQPSYEIVEDVAWDHLEETDPLKALVARADAVCFGTLGQRREPARSTIRSLLRQSHRALKLFDMNLRPPFDSPDVVEASLELADVLKLNEEELEITIHRLSLPEQERRAVEALMSTYSLQWVALTRGPRGTTLHLPDREITREPYPAKPGGNPVGAGDATAAMLLHGALRQWDWNQTVDKANRLGAWVASNQGACPPPPPP